MSAVPHPPDLVLLLELVQAHRAAFGRAGLVGPVRCEDVCVGHRGEHLADEGAGGGYGGVIRAGFGLFEVGGGLDEGGQAEETEEGEDELAE